MLLLCELVCGCAGVTLFQAKASKYILYLHITTSIHCFMQKHLNTLFHPAFSMHFNAAAGLNLHLTPEFSAFVRVFSISPFFRQHFLHITGHSVPPGISVFPPFLASFLHFSWSTMIRAVTQLFAKEDCTLPQAMFSQFHHQRR